MREINNKGLLYSMGNYIHYLAVTYNRRKPEKDSLNHFASENKLPFTLKLSSWLGYLQKNEPSNAFPQENLTCGFKSDFILSLIFQEKKSYSSTKAQLKPSEFYNRVLF